MTSSLRLLFTLMSVVTASRVVLHVGITDEKLAQDFLNDYDVKMKTSYNELVTTSWAYHTNITTENSDRLVEVNLKNAELAQELAHNASVFDWTTFSNATTRRQFAKITDIGVAAMKNKTKLARMNNLLAQMGTIYSTGKACLKNKGCVPLDPDLTRTMATSRDYDELLEAWIVWRDVSGKKMINLYPEFVTLSNEAVNMSGYQDTGDYWRSWYESETFEEDVEDLFNQVQPLYAQIHAYTRSKLKHQYSQHEFPSTGHIPAHILGNMWAQQWDTLRDILLPYQDKPAIDITDQLVKQVLTDASKHIKQICVGYTGYSLTDLEMCVLKLYQNYTIDRMFRVSDDFFKSLGMIRMPQEFWDHSMLERPRDGREVNCHASAWDFYNGSDVRIKQCTDRTHTSMTTVHHEMGHVEYFLQYNKQPVIFRGGPNPGFHEGVADIAALSFQTPKHLHNIGLLPEIDVDKESDINFLLAMGLQKIAFIPFGYLIDLWRWSVFKGKTTPADYNNKWWELRCRYQGVYPPVQRNDDDFDPGAKFHIPGNTPYIRYFVSFIIQFQFHKELCRLANHTGPLHLCSIFNSTEAGDRLSEMLKLGSSKPWPEAMRVLTGQEKMDAQPLMEYFKPLYNWLIKQNANERVGWHPACPIESMQTGGASVAHAQIVTLAFIVYEIIHKVF